MASLWFFSADPLPDTVLQKRLPLSVCWVFPSSASVPYPRADFFKYTDGHIARPPVVPPLARTARPSETSGDSVFNERLSTFPKTSAQKPSFCPLTFARKTRIMVLYQYRRIIQASEPSFLKLPRFTERPDWETRVYQTRAPKEEEGTILSPPVKGELRWCASIIAKKSWLVKRNSQDFFASTFCTNVLGGNMVNVGKIRQLASKRGIKMKYLCEQLGVNPGYFANVDQGRFQMPPEKIYAVAELLGTTFNYLTDQTDFPISVAHMERSFMYDRYEKLKIERSLTSNYVERTIGIPYGSMEYVQKKALNLSEEQVNKLAILLNTTYEYLMGLSDDPEIPADDHTGVKIKLFGDVAAGIPIKQIDNFDPDDETSWEEINRSTAKNGIYFALRIKGDSMEPRIMNGDRVIVRYQESVESGQTAVVAINGDTAACKKVFYDDQNGMSLVSNNSKYPPRYFTAEQVRSIPVRILGLVVEIRGLP